MMKQLHTLFKPIMSLESETLQTQKTNTQTSFGTYVCDIHRFLPRYDKLHCYGGLVLNINKPYAGNQQVILQKMCFVQDRNM